MQETLEKLLYSIPVTPYAKKNKEGALIGDGVSKDLFWEAGGTSHKLLSAESPPTSHCVGFVFEYLILVFLHYGKKLELEAVQELLYRTFISEGKLKSMGFPMDATDPTWQGAPRALVDFGWAEEIADPYDAKIGDVVQLWNFKLGTGERTTGHATIARGLIGKSPSGYDTFLNRGSNVPQYKDDPGGVQDDWHTIDGSVLSRPVRREFTIARFKEDWLKS